MATKTPATRHPELRLAVQYGTPAPELPRWRLRRWIQRGLNAAARDRATIGATVINAAELTLRLVDSAEGLELNTTYRGRNYATNVLTFEYGVDPEGTARGDIVLCVPVLHREAQEQGKPMLHHAAHLTIHGVLHALGYDHLEADEAAHMEAMETALLGTLGIPDPYQG